jgi:hypothetical protein
LGAYDTVIVIFKVTAESKVDHKNVVFVIKNYVLWFNISMI